MSEKTPTGTTKHADYSKKYREKIKSDPEKYKAELQKQHDWYAKRKALREEKWYTGTKAERIKTNE